MTYPGYPNGPPDGLSVLAKAKWRKWKGQWCLLVSPVWGVRMGANVEFKRMDGKVTRITVGDYLGNTGPSENSSLDMKDVFLPLDTSAP